VEDFFKQQGARLTIQSNDIEPISPLFSRKKWAISLQNCAKFHTWQFHQDLFVCWGKESTRIGFFEGHMKRELDLFRQCMIGKQELIFLARYGIYRQIFNMILQDLVSFKYGF